MKRKKVLLLCGGGGPEHEISLVSAKYFETTLLQEKSVDLTKVELKKEGLPSDFYNTLTNSDYVIPCIHGFPGETGDIQSVLEMLKIPYLGANSEASKICFNKISAKLWLSSIRIPVTPYVYVNALKDLKKAESFFTKHGRVFVKPSSQGSSVGCTLVTNASQIKTAIEEALKYSPYALIEKGLKAREIEVSVYELKGKIKVSNPGEVIISKCQDPFYSYKEKYDPASKAYTDVVAKNLDKKISKKIMSYAKKSFKILNIKHLARVDFFYSEEGKVYLNEINTFPGLTPISMFPKMMEANGTPFKKFLMEKINGKGF